MLLICRGFCDNCLCTNCCNTLEAASLVDEAKKNIIKARPSAFDPKVPTNCALCVHVSDQHVSANTHV